MVRSNSNMVRQIAQAASAFEQQRTGQVPKSVTVVLSENTLVIRLHGALSPAEQALAKSPEGAAQVQEFHRQLFANASDSLRREIKKITGVEVRESSTEIEPASGTVVGVFTSGAMVPVFLLSQIVPSGTWSGIVFRRPNKENGSSAMLVLSRKNDQAVVIGGSDHSENMPEVTVLETSGGNVRPGLEGNKDAPVPRAEVWEGIRVNGRAERPAEIPAAPKQELSRWEDDGGGPDRPTTSLVASAPFVGSSVNHPRTESPSRSRTRPTPKGRRLLKCSETSSSAA